MEIDQRIDLTAEHRKVIVALIAQHLPNTTVWAFGSRTKWTSNSKSDLDLVAFANQSQRLHVGALQEELEESDLPFRVDLLVWEELSEQFKAEIRNNYCALTEG